jgi:hypothetical protein
MAKKPATTLAILNDIQRAADEFAREEADALAAEPIDDATLCLARVHEKHVPDTEGRATAAAAVVQQLLKRARRAKLRVDPGRDSRGDFLQGDACNVFDVRLSALASVRVAHHEGVLLDGEQFEGIEFDPLTRRYDGLNGEPGVKVLAQEVARRLDALATKASEPREEPDPRQLMALAEEN